MVGIASIALLAISERQTQRHFEAAVIALLIVITFGFLGGLVMAPPNWGETAEGMIPAFKGSDSVLVAASMLGATVMPHAIYLHSSLVNDRHGSEHDDQRTWLWPRYCWRAQ